MKQEKQGMKQEGLGMQQEKPGRKREKLKKARELWTRGKKQPAFLWAFQIVAVLFFAIVVALFFFQSVTMRENSMEPTLDTGDRIFVNRFSYQFSEPKRGDIIVFKTSASDDAALHIKRVIGLPGESVRISDGEILIDGEVYQEAGSFPVIQNPGLAETSVTLGSGIFLFWGIIRNNSEDSRYGDIGNVQKTVYSGQGMVCIFALGKIWIFERLTDEYTMVSWPYDESKTSNAGRYKIDRSADRTCGCAGAHEQPESGCGSAWTEQSTADSAQ